MKRIVYLHGFNSSPDSKKASELFRFLTARGKATSFDVPHLHHRPSIAMQNVEEKYDSADPDDITLVGSSLGGFYATYLTEKYGFRSVLVNPAVAAARSLAQYVGAQTNLYTGEQYELTPLHIEELKALAVSAPSRLDRYWLLVEIGDETLDYREAVAFYRGARQLVIEGGDHGFQAWGRLLPQVVEFAGL